MIWDLRKSWTKEKEEGAKSPATKDKVTPQRTIAFAGVRVLSSNALKNGGRSPSRAIAKRMRVNP